MRDVPIARVGREEDFTRIEGAKFRAQIFGRTGRACTGVGDDAAFHECDNSGGTFAVAAAEATRLPHNNLSHRRSFP